MMRKTIVRTFATSKITAYKLAMIDGVPSAEPLEPVIVMGEASEKEAMKAVKEKYGKDALITISDIEVTKDTYKISVEDFLAHAVKVDAKEAEVETEN